MEGNKPIVHIKQIAEHLGVSPGTVSIVLNGRGDEMRISKKTQQRVQDIVKELNYQPNIYARRLRKSDEQGAPYIIAVFWRSEFIDDLLVNFLQGMYRSIKQNNLNIEVVLQPYDFGNLEKYKLFINSNRFNGAIISGLSNEDQMFLEQNDFDIPIVLIGRNTKKYNSVFIDYYDTGESCAKLFISRNHNKIGLVGMVKKGKPSQLIEMSFRETCKIKNARIDEDWIYYCDKRNFDCGYDAAMSILSNLDRPTALFVMDNRNAGGVFNACRSLGLVIPNDLEILVFGEIEYFSYSNPTISSVYQPIHEYAETALNMIMVAVKSRVTIPMMQEHNPIFNFRESCGGFIE